MKRAIHMIVSVLAILLLVRPLDCFASAKATQEAMDCCLKGKCAPTAQSDDCCKNTVPDSVQLVVSKAGFHTAPLVVLPIASISIEIPRLSSRGSISSLTHPPPSPTLTARNLPLLI
jgi:hypothetical protein